MTDEITPTEGDDFEPSYDFSHPEDVLIEVVFDPDRREGFFIETATVVNAHPTKSGAASYEIGESGLFDYTLLGMLSLTDFSQGEGWYVLPNLTGFYTRGDGWMTDDDMQLYHGPVRPATADEIAQA